MAYESETDALLARFSGSPTTDEEIAYDNIIYNLKEEGIWSKLHALILLATYDATDALLNIISSSFNLSHNGSPTFNAEEGYIYDGSQYGLTGYNPVSSPGSIDPSDFSMGMYLGDSTPSGDGDAIIGGGTSGSNLTTIDRTTTQLRYCVGASRTAITDDFAVNTLYTVRRTGGTQSLVENSTELNNDAKTLQSDFDFEVYINSFNAAGAAGGIADDECRSYFIGDYLTVEEIGVIKTQIDKFITEIGAEGNTQDSGSGSDISSDITQGSTIASSIIGIANLSSDIDGDSIIASILSGIGVLAATVSQGSVVSSNLDGVGLLNSNISNSTSLEFTLNALGNIESNISNESNISSLLVGLVELNSNISQGTSLSSGILGIGVLASSILGNTEIDSSLGEPDDIFSDVTGSTSLIATLVGIGVISSNISGSSSISSNLIADAYLQSSINGNSFISSSVGDSTKLEVPLAGSMSLLAAITGFVKINSVIGGSLDIIANLTNYNDIISQINGLSSLEGTIKGVAYMSCSIAQGTEINSAKIKDLNKKPQLIKNLFKLNIGSKKVYKAYIGNIEIS